MFPSSLMLACAVHVYSIILLVFAACGVYTYYVHNFIHVAMGGCTCRIIIDQQNRCEILFLKISHNCCKLSDRQWCWLATLTSPQLECGSSCRLRRWSTPLASSTPIQGHLTLSTICHYDMNRVYYYSENAGILTTLTTFYS